MSTSGASAWKKYFQGNGDVETVMKKVSPAFDPAKPNTKLGDIPAGTNIVYIKSAVYEPKALIKFTVNRKTTFCRVPFDNIAKPNTKASGAPSLKPQAFGIQDRFYTIKDYKETILDSIDSRDDLKPELKGYLTSLFDYCSGGRTTMQQLAKNFQLSKNDLPLNDINKDFGEVVGPVGAYEFQLLRRKSITLPPQMKIKVPLRPNEPLMDYGLYVGDRQYTISAKSGKSTNTVKPKDIIELLKVNPRKLSKWKNTNQYKVLEILDNNSALIGPIKAVAYLKPDLIDPKQADKIVSATSSTAGLITFIKQNTYLAARKDPTINEIMYECEKIIAEETKSGSLNMNDIFSAAVEEKVLYIKFALSSTGIPEWDVIASDDITGPSYGRLTLRSKNGYTRASDKLGIQV